MAVIFPPEFDLIDDNPLEPRLTQRSEQSTAQLAANWPDIAAAMDACLRQGDASGAAARAMLLFQYRRELFFRFRKNFWLYRRIEAGRNTLRQEAA